MSVSLLFLKTSKPKISNGYNIAVVEINNYKIIADIADTPASRRKGLGGREKLEKGRGMLFVFDEPDIYPFWMKDMRFPIDIIWILDDKVVEIWEDAPPPTGSNIPRYTPKNKANFVLEIPAGEVERYNIKIGDRVNLQLSNFQ